MWVDGVWGEAGCVPELSPPSLPIRDTNMHIYRNIACSEHPPLLYENWPRWPSLPGSMRDFVGMLHIRDFEDWGIT